MLESLSLGVMSASQNGRLVLNHSTHLPGLLPILERLSQSSGVQTVTPGVIANVRAHSPNMVVKVSVPIRGGFKLIARRGKTVQEVFVLTTLNPEQLQAAIAQAMHP
jgi:hypothetical protein